MSRLEDVPIFHGVGSHNPGIGLAFVEAGKALKKVVHKEGRNTGKNTVGPEGDKE